MQPLGIDCKREEYPPSEQPCNQGRFTLWARWALAQGPAPEGAPHLLDVPLGKVEKEREKERNKFCKETTMRLDG